MSVRARVAAAATTAAAAAFLVGSRDGGSTAGQRSSLRNPDEEASCRRLGLMTPTDAQRTEVVALRSFLTRDEVAALKAEIAACGGGVARIERSARGAPAFIGPWVTTYVHTGGVFAAKFGPLRRRLVDAARAVDAESWRVLGADAGGVNVRTCEFHRYGRGGALCAERHYDAGSLITMGLMLSRPGVDFDGGAFVTPEADGTVARHAYDEGDLLLFVSHKYHNVEPVTRGARTVLITELWRGPEKACAHRCETLGDCDYTLGRARLAALAQHAAFLG